MQGFRSVRRWAGSMNGQCQLRSEDTEHRPVAACAERSGTLGFGGKTLASAIAGLVASWTVACDAATSVLLTVDVESRAVGGSPDADIFGRLPQSAGEHGVPRILDVLRQHHASATFYLNVYEAASFGEAPLRDVARKIVSAGQDLQLHTHPGPMFGRSHISDYDVREQYEILEKGKALIAEWTGRPVIAHRAGGFKANLDTLEAVARAGLEVDASLSPAGTCPLAAQGHRENDVVRHGPTLLLPVTYYTQVEGMGYRSLRFLDIESSSLAEIRHVLDVMAARRACAVNIMMHSFSLVRTGYLDARIANRLEAVLDYVAQRPELQLRTTREFLAAYQEDRLECTPQPGFVPYTGWLMTYARAWERIDDGWKNVLFAMAPPAATLSVLAILALLLSRRSRSSGERA